VGLPVADCALAPAEGSAFVVDGVG
jgi:hypothetical protein